MKKNIFKIIMLLCLISSFIYSQTEVPKNRIHPKIPGDGISNHFFSVMVYYNPSTGKYYYYDPSGVSVSVAFPDSTKIYGSVTSSDELSIVNASNSSATPLSGGATFTGEWVETKYYTNVSIMVSSDVSSASDGLVFQQSIDAVNIDDTDSFTIEAGAKKQFTFGITSKYARVVYTNGVSDQSEFGLQFMFHKGSPKPSSHRIQDNIVDEDDAELVKSILSARKPNGDYTNIEATAAGNLKNSIEEIDPNSGLFSTYEYSENSSTVTTEIDSIDVSSGANVWYSMDIIGVEDTLEFSFNRNFTTPRRLFPNQSKYVEKVSVSQFPKVYIRRKGSYGACVYDIDFIGF